MRCRSGTSLDSFHAYAVPDGIDIRPGDVVQVHGMPSRLQFGEARRFRARATVSRAGALRRSLDGACRACLN